MFDYLCDLLLRMSDFYSTHCLLGLLVAYAAVR